MPVALLMAEAFSASFPKGKRYLYLSDPRDMCQQCLELTIKFATCITSILLFVCIFCLVGWLVFFCFFVCFVFVFVFLFVFFLGCLFGLVLILVWFGLGFVLFCFIETCFFCCPGCPRTLSVDLADLELRSTCLCLLSAGIKVVCHRRPQ